MTELEFVRNFIEEYLKLNSLSTPRGFRSIAGLQSERENFLMFLSKGGEFFGGGWFRGGRHRFCLVWWLWGLRRKKDERHLIFEREKGQKIRLGSDFGIILD